MSRTRGTNPLNPRRVRNNTWEHAMSMAMGTTPLNPRRVRNNTWEHAR
jgi:hypothetical protein